MNMHPPRQSEGDEAVVEMRKAEKGIEGGRRGRAFIKKFRMSK
jgi:hypothetical protein